MDKFISLKENTQKGSKEVFNVEANGWYRAAMENIVEINEEFRAVSASQKVDVLYEKAITVTRNCRRGKAPCQLCDKVWHDAKACPRFNKPKEEMEGCYTCGGRTHNQLSSKFSKEL